MNKLSYEDLVSLSQESNSAYQASGLPIPVQINQVNFTGTGVTVTYSGNTLNVNINAAPLSDLNFQGLWNASTNSPVLTSGVGTTGAVYKVSVAGTTTLDGINQWNVGDYVLFDGAHYGKIDGNPAEVLSVAGRTGAVVLSASDISGVALLAGNTAQTFSVAPATGSAMAVPLGQLQTLLGNFSKNSIYVDAASVWTSSDSGSVFSVNAGTQTLPLASTCSAGNSFLFYASNPMSVIAAGTDTIYLQGLDVPSISFLAGDWALFIQNSVQWEVVAASPRILVLSSLSTKTNVLDDGSGNMTVGSITSLGGGLVLGSSTNTVYAYNSGSQSFTVRVGVSTAYSFFTVRGSDGTVMVGGGGLPVLPATASNHAVQLGQLQNHGRAWTLMLWTDLSQWTATGPLTNQQMSLNVMSAPSDLGITKIRLQLSIAVNTAVAGGTVTWSLYGFPEVSGSISTATTGWQSVDTGPVTLTSPLTNIIGHVTMTTSVATSVSNGDGQLMLY